MIFPKRILLSNGLKSTGCVFGLIISVNFPREPIHMMGQYPVGWVPSDCWAYPVKVSAIGRGMPFKEVLPSEGVTLSAFWGDGVERRGCLSPEVGTAFLWHCGNADTHVNRMTDACENIIFLILRNPLKPLLAFIALSTARSRAQTCIHSVILVIDTSNNVSYNQLICR